MTTIEKGAFANCKNLKSITIKTGKLTKKSVGKNAFKGISSKVVVKVPQGKVKAYKKMLQARGLSK
ncbi:MAG: leucine-rich repeat protein [Firmicutes bacterium]|nr:leucine-rich repeat protein [Bacillota bacterium]